MRFSFVATVLAAGFSALPGTFAAPTGTELSKRYEQHTGEVTWYNVGLGACGWTHNDSEFIVAVSHQYFDTFPGYAGGNPNNNPICGKRMNVYNPSTGKTIVVGVADRCEGCKLSDIDLSPAAFKAIIGDLSIGRRSNIRWRVL